MGFRYSIECLDETCANGLIDSTVRVDINIIL